MKIIVAKQTQKCLSTGQCKISRGLMSEGADCVSRSHRFDNLCLHAVEDCGCSNLSDFVEAVGVYTLKWRTEVRFQATYICMSAVKTEKKHHVCTK